MGRRPRDWKVLTSFPHDFGGDSFIVELVPSRPPTVLGINIVHDFVVDALGI
ncbi:hypothetical protein M413DRAFT_448785 [Hebeloma cylindrosporum]|uniref:Uncharacterized protein n=1 Tax=Hebeloma cylindrosporum TaxID=76867 RepID=A0A0C3BYJ7_HEBCY|nr:hypothetical protein M413DRAFT_448785 [Hebeloma cylindrosporum h7]